MKNSPSEAFDEKLAQAQRDDAPELRNSQKDHVSFGRKTEDDPEFLKKNPSKTQGKTTTAGRSVKIDTKNPAKASTKPSPPEG